MKFGNGQGGHVIVVSAIKLFPFKKYTYVKKKLNLLQYIYIFSYYY